MDVLEGGGGGNEGLRRQGSVNLFNDWKNGLPTVDGDVDLSVLLKAAGGGDGDGNNPGFDFGD